MGVPRIPPLWVSLLWTLRPVLHVQGQMQAARRQETETCQLRPKVVKVEQLLQALLSR